MSVFPQRVVARQTPSSFLQKGYLPSFQQKWYSSDGTIELKVPKMGDSVTEGTLLEWTKGVGDSVAEDEVVCSIETDKVTVEIRAPAAGTVQELKAAAGSTVLVDAPIMVIKAGASGSSYPKLQAALAVTAAPPKAEAPEAEAPRPPTTPAPAAPVNPAPKAAAPTKSAAASAPVAATETRGERRVAMSRMRQRIAQRLKESQNTAAMLTTFNEVDMSKIIGLRNQHKEAFEKKHGVKLGFMSAFVRASCLALQTVPAVNAVIDGNDIVYRDYADVSVAVASPRGLVVPVIRNAHAMSFAEIEKEIGRLGERARKDEITLEEMAGGTFTVSNGGVYGSLYGTPIINPPQSAILGMHATKDRAVVVNGQVIARPMMYLALTYDHRLIDGREAVTFLKTVCQFVEDPARMLLDV